MSGRPHLCDVSLLLLVTAALVLYASAYNDDRPIFKWSPNFFNSYYRRSMYKRFNEDRPYYKWSPHMFQRYAGTFKRSVSEEDPLQLCVPSAELCQPGPQAPPCCGLLQCLPDTQRFSCQHADAQPDSDISLDVDTESSGESESDDSPASSGMTRLSWYGRAPPPFFPRPWA